MTTFKITNLESVGWEHALRGMRNPMMSHSYSDTVDGELGNNDKQLCVKLAQSGPSHRKFLRQIMIYCDITACLKWWDEFDTYLHVVKNSSSQMHTLGRDDITLSDFCFGEDPDSIDLELINLIKVRLRHYVNAKNKLKTYLVEGGNVGDDKGVELKNSVNKSWRRLLDNVPQSYLYTRTCCFNYEVFMSMYNLRKDHKMVEWRLFCEELYNRLPYMGEFIS
jgi:hypothetical protein